MKEKSPINLFRSDRHSLRFALFLSTFLLLITAIFSVMLNASPALAVESPRQVVTESSDENAKRILIVYLTRTENTKAIAHIIHQEVGGDLVELVLQKPYPEDYETIVAQVDKENKTGYLPPLKTKVDDFKDYDTIFIGFPTWDMQLPPPMKSFMHEYDFAGKQVIPFNTNGGYGVGSSFRDIKELAPNADIVDGFSIRGGLEKEGVFLAIKGERREQARAEVIGWLRDIQMLSK